MSLLRLSLRAFVAVATSFAVCSITQADDFRFLPKNVLSVEACTHEGEIAVVGDVDLASGVRAYRWTKGGGLEVVGTLGTESHANAVSVDGSVVVGEMITMTDQTHGFVWTEADGTVDIGSLGGPFTVANDVSADGQVIVGTSEDADGFLHAFRATLTEALDQNLTDLGTLGGDESEALFVSADGEVAVGRSQANNGDWHLFLWTEADGMVDLGSLGGDDLFVKDISDDASVIVGEALNNAGAGVPFIWTEATGLIRIPGIGDVVGSVELVSDDGATIFGQAAIGSPVLKAFSVNLDTLDVDVLGSLFKKRASFVTSASLDASVIGGQALNADGDLEAFLQVDVSTPPGFLEADKLVSLKRILKKVFKPKTIEDLFFVDVPCISSDGHTLIVEAQEKGETVFLYVEIGKYPKIGDGNGGGGDKFFDTRPYRAEIVQYVTASVESALALSESQPDSEIAYYVYLYAYYASIYQDLAANLEVEGEVDAKLRGLYASYRYNALILTYYAYVLDYYYLYLPSGGEDALSAELLTNLYYSYYYQQLDLDDVLDDEDELLPNE